MLKNDIIQFKQIIQTLFDDKVVKIYQEDMLKFCGFLYKSTKENNIDIEKINNLFDTDYDKSSFEYFVFKNIKYYKDLIPNVIKYIVLYDNKNNTNYFDNLFNLYKKIQNYFNIDNLDCELLLNNFIQYKDNVNNNKPNHDTINIDMPHYQTSMNSYNVLQEQLNKLKTAQQTMFIEPKTDEIPKIVNKAESIKEDPRSLDELLNELNELTGLDGVKKEINDLINLIKVNNMRKEYDLLDSNISKHMVFSGNPGTGKTTIARLLGNIYKKLGVLSTGQLIETSRSELVAGYVGQTAIKTKEVIEKAKGGILFIDEAYTLSRNTQNDFGQEAIDELLKEMEDNRDDLVVIVAGYPDLMEEFLDSNPGLASRFNKFIHFEDYDEQELFSIFKYNLNKRQFEISSETEDFIKEKLKDIIKNKDDNFGNARVIRNIIEKAIQKQASRIATINNITKKDLLYLEIEDFKQ